MKGLIKTINAIRGKAEEKEEKEQHLVEDKTERIELSAQYKKVKS